MEIIEDGNFGREERIDSPKNGEWQYKGICFVKCGERGGRFKESKLCYSCMYPTLVK